MKKRNNHQLKLFWYGMKLSAHIYIQRKFAIFSMWYYWSISNVSTLSGPMVHLWRTLDPEHSVRPYGPRVRTLDPELMSLNLSGSSFSEDLHIPAWILVRNRRGIYILWCQVKLSELVLQFCKINESRIKQSVEKMLPNRKIISLNIVTK